MPFDPHRAPALRRLGIAALLGTMTVGTAAVALNVWGPHPTDTVPRLTVEAAKTRYDGSQRPMLWDVRDSSHYADGHILGAHSVPEDQVGAVVAGMDRHTPVIAYCQ